MHSFRTEAIVIKRRNFGEADRILTVVTPHHGKVKIKAPGVRKISSKRSSHIELLNHSVLNLHSGKMLILTEAETLHHYSGLKNDLHKSGLSFYVCELLDGLLPENQENIAVFNLLKKILGDLEAKDNHRLIINKFEQELLTLLGFWPKERVFLENPDQFIENLMEKKFKTKTILHRL